MFSYSYKYAFCVCTICNSIGNRSLLPILLLQGGLCFFIPYSDDFVIDDIINKHLSLSQQTCRRAKVILLHMYYSIERVENCSYSVKVSRTVASNTVIHLPKGSKPQPLCQARCLVGKEIKPPVY